MSGRQLELDEDLVFARQLLDAGRAEPVPSARTAPAFSAFAASMAALQGHELGAGLAPSTGASSAGWGGQWIVGKWVVLGALLGSAATVVWLEQRVTSNSSAPSVVTASPSAVRVAAPQASVDAVGSAQSSPVVPLVGEGEPRSATAKRGPVKAPAVLQQSEAPESRLAAEVAALDGIRTALAIGAWRDVELQLARYRREFARGALRNDAEVLAITALATQGRKQAAAAAARAFLANHPRDAQAASVRALVE
jgi:hypothetical protein